MTESTSALHLIRREAVRKAEEIAQATEWSGDPRINFLTAINAAKVLHKEVERLRAEIEEVQDEWQSAVYGTLENGVRWVNEGVSKKFAKDYPAISSFGTVLARLAVEAKMEEVKDDSEQEGENEQ